MSLCTAPGPPRTSDKCPIPAVPNIVSVRHLMEHAFVWRFVPRILAECHGLLSNWQSFDRWTVAAKLRAIRLWLHRHRTSRPFGLVASGHPSIWSRPYRSWWTRSDGVNSPRNKFPSHSWTLVAYLSDYTSWSPSSTWSFFSWSRSLWLLDKTCRTRSLE